MTYDATVLSHSPHFYLPMTEVAGSTTLTDASGNGHTGTRNTFSPPLPTIGGADGAITGDKAVLMPGRGSEIDFAAASGCSATGSFTLDYWVKWADPTNADNDIDFLYDGPYPNRLIASLNNVSPTDLEFALTLNGTRILDYTFTLPHPSCWHYYAYTYDGTSAKIYLDGALIYTNSDSSIAGLIWSTTYGGYWYNSGAVITTTAAFDFNHSAFYRTALLAGDIAAIYAAATPRQDMACFSVPLRLRHNLGHVVFESDDATTRLRALDADVLTHDGTTLSVHSGSNETLRVPFPVASSPPAAFLGMDAISGLPATSALPTPANHGLAPVIPPVPVVTTSSTCDPLRCGAAANMRDHLLSLYSAWATVLGPAVKFAEVFGVDAAISALAELALDALALGPFAAAVWAAIAPAMATILTLAIPVPLPGLTSDQSDVIWNGAYCQLTCSGDVVDPTSTQVQAWNSYLTAHSSAFTSPSLQLALLNALLDFTPLLDWQTAAATATPNSECAGFTCP